MTTGRTVELRVLCEGQTERNFVRSVLRPHLAAFRVFATDLGLDMRSRPGGGIIWRDDENTILASLDRAGDELLVEVDSEQRLAAARALLDGVPGVQFVSQRAQDPTGDAGVPRDAHDDRSDRTGTAGLRTLREHPRREPGLAGEAAAEQDPGSSA